MEDVIVGIVTVLVGTMFCIRGYLAMRVVIPVWGAFTGFVVGAGTVAAVAGDGFLSTDLGWVVGLGVAVLFFAIAHRYYEVSVVIAMTAVGFAIGVAVMGALGEKWDWVVIIVGVAVGVALAWFTIVSNLPMAILTALSALGGASTIITGLMLVVGTLSLDDFDHGATTERTNDNPWWYVLYGSIVLVGIVAQIARAERMSATLREAWMEDGGRQLRTV